MLKTQYEANYFVWFNPLRYLYESGEIQAYEACLELSNQDEHTSLILKFDKKSQQIADRIVKELNVSKNKLI